MKENKRFKSVWVDCKRILRLIFLIGSSSVALISCQSSGNHPKFGNPLIKAEIRYLESNGELSGTWSFFQRNQLDSLVPDARLHQFIINGQKVSSEKVKNNYHMYLVADTLISQNLNVQILPANRVVSINMPLIPLIEPDRLQPGLDWTFTWDPGHFNPGDSISLVLSDSTKQTVLSAVQAQAGQLTLPYSRTRNLAPGPGFYYIISRTHRRKELNNVDFEYNIEVYSVDIPVKIYQVKSEN